MVDVRRSLMLVDCEAMGPTGTGRQAIDRCVLEWGPGNNTGEPGTVTGHSSCDVERLQKESWSNVHLVEK
ncbi:hypothetical protein EYF80_001641 [Liparis tanakae]|uniref:Uncharacterized protein n=1 Tax=Liparis tanakae TaxID=230148 RepID=A0A4Z2JD16_9TELE|nr:hypothetical protein EYF80_001641 [Liparis tanakae]